MIGVDAATLSFIDGVAGAIEAVLGPDLVGIELYGSAVTGGFDPGVSDVDLLIVTSTAIESVDLGGLATMHAAIVDRAPDWRDHVDAVYISRASLRAFRTSREPMAVISPGEPFHRVSDRPVDWLQNWFYARETGVALRGPAARSLIPPISSAELVGAVRRYAGEVAGRDRSTASGGAIAYAILTLCRAWRTVETGAMTSKAQGAAWATHRLPGSSSVIETALRVRRGLDGFAGAVSRSSAEVLIAELGRRVAAT
jgi:streptomycin 3"-adenylyltransferase